MLKWLWLCAFLVNLLAFYWFYSQPEGRVENKSIWEESAAGIVLMSELKVIAPDRSLSVAEAISLEKRGSGDEASGGVNLEKSSLSESLIKEEHQLVQNTGDMNKTVDVEQKASVITVAPTVESIVKQKEESVMMASKLETPGSLPCVLLGRFDSERDATGLLEKLQKQVGVSVELQLVTEGKERYLVYMSPFDTKLEARQQQSVLKENGIRSSLYYKGAMENGLSLGFFASKSNANRRYEGLLAAGYEVELKTMVTEISSYWLEFERQELEKLSQLFWRDLGKKFPNVLSKPAECSSVH